MPIRLAGSRRCRRRAGVHPILAQTSQLARELIPRSRGLRWLPQTPGADQSSPRRSALQQTQHMRQGRPTHAERANHISQQVLHWNRRQRTGDCSLVLDHGVLEHIGAHVICGHRTILQAESYHIVVLHMGGPVDATLQPGFGHSRSKCAIPLVTGTGKWKQARARLRVESHCSSCGWRRLEAGDLLEGHQIVQRHLHTGQCMQ